jgi:hypothetical protein
VYFATGLMVLFSLWILIPPCKGGDVGFVCVKYLIFVCLLRCHDFEWLFVLTCICLGARFFVWPSRTSCPIDVTPGILTATGTYIGYHVKRFKASRNVILHTRYVSTCVGAGCERGRETKIHTKAKKQSKKKRTEFKHIFRFYNFNLTIKNKYIFYV